jgi:hypothetical protein
MKRFGIVFTILVLTNLFGPAQSASSAENLGPRIAERVAGKPVNLRCVTSPMQWNSLVKRYFPNFRGTHVHAFAIVGGTEIRTAGWVCKALNGPVSENLGPALNVIAHEAAHVRGIRSEAEASCWGLMWVAHLAWEFYGIEFDSLASKTLLAASREYHLNTPKQYQAVCK